METGGDGLHLWFLLGTEVIRNSAGRLGPGLDVRGDGGYVVVPPSRHRSGSTHHWAEAWHPTLGAKSMTVKIGAGAKGNVSARFSYKP